MLSERTVVVEGEGGGGIKAKLAARFKRRSEDSPEKKVEIYGGPLEGSRVRMCRGAAAVRHYRGGGTRCEVLATLRDEWPCLVAPNMVGSVSWLQGVAVLAS